MARVCIELCHCIAWLCSRPVEDDQVDPMCFHVLDKGEKGNDETRSPVRRQLSLLSQSQWLFQVLT